MSQVYNAYQSYILSHSLAFQAHRKLYGSFAKFSSSLAKDLTRLEVAGDDSSDSEGGDGGNSIQQTEEGSVLNTSGRSVTYNKRELSIGPVIATCSSMQSGIKTKLCLVLQKEA